MLNKKFLGLALALSFAASANAAPLKGGACWAHMVNNLGLYDGLTFNCALLGKVNISEIYAAGYKVTNVAMTASTPRAVSIVIEEQQRTE